MNKVEKIVLENGLRVILVNQPQSLTTTVLVLVEAGSKYESKKTTAFLIFLSICALRAQKNGRIR